MASREIDPEDLVTPCGFALYDERCIAAWVRAEDGEDGHASSQPHPCQPTHRARHQLLPTSVCSGKTDCSHTLGRGGTEWQGLGVAGKTLSSGMQAMQLNLARNLKR